MFELCSLTWPPLYANYFVLNAEVHDYNTRATYMFVALCVLWNRLPARLKLPSSIPVFKRKIKKYLNYSQ